MRSLFLAGLFFGAMVPAALSADLEVPVEPAEEIRSSDWHFAIATYGWATALSGTSSVGNLPPTDISVSLSDIPDLVSNLDAGIFATAEIGYRRWLAFSDLQYVKMTDAEATPFGILATRQKLRSESLSWLFTGGYRVLDEPRWTVDALAGGRLYGMSSRISVSGGTLGTQGRERTETWLDPVIGAKARYHLAPSVGFTTWGFLGGFGVGSDINWDVLGVFTWSPWENVNLALGYRASGVDYETTGFTYDAVQQGPIVGLVLRF